MHYRLLGHTGLEVSVLSLGGHEYRWGIQQGHLDQGRFSKLNPERLRVVERALELGVNYADTTFAEEVQSLGSCLRQLGARERMIVSGMIIAPQRRWQGATAVELTRNWEDEVTERLRLLGGDHFDIFLLGVLHQEYDPGMARTLYELLARTRDSGRTRFIGVSAHRYDVLSRFLDLELPIDVVMLPYSYPVARNWGGLYADLAGFLCRADAHGIGLVAIKSLVWTLYGAPCCIHAEADADPGAVLAAALAWQCRQSVPATTVIGVETVAELENDLAALDLPVDESLLAGLLARARQFDVMLRNAPRQAADVRDRIREYAGDFTGMDLGEDWTAYQTHWQEHMERRLMPYLRPGS